MAGRIRDADVALLRERSSLAEIIGQYVQLRSGGGGRLKGLCPFHDEKTPSFYVNPANGYYKCFGCGAGGDVISFVREQEHLSFVEAVEKLAARAGMTLTYEQGGMAPGRETSVRQRLLEAHQAAAEFYAEQLGTPAARPAREFLAARGFDQQAALAYGCGYAPDTWDALYRHLTGRGFRPDELQQAALAKPSSRGTLIDAFRGRLIWPIRDITAAVVGFNGRRLRDDDERAPKYVNSAETPIFHKSRVLYGIDIAKRAIAQRRQVVVVEGVTDVMACHLAGVPTAVATCGTAFGDEHVKILRRLLLDQDALRGEVIFTFDGDAAGQKAALRAFDDDQAFVAQTFVAVEPTGLDPCELRLAHGDTAVRDLVARRVPLVDYVLRARLARYDLDTVEGRVGALDATAPLVAALKDRSMGPEYTRRLAGLLGMEVEQVGARVRELSGDRPPPPRARQRLLDRDDVAVSTERETLKVAVQRPALAGPAFDALAAEVFSLPAHQAVQRAVQTAGGVAAARSDAGWVAAVRDAAGDDAIRDLVTALAVEPLLYDGEDVERYAREVLVRVELLAVDRAIAVLKGKVQRLNAADRAEEFNAAFTELLTVEQRRRYLLERSVT